MSVLSKEDIMIGDWVMLVDNTSPPRPIQIKTGYQICDADKNIYRGIYLNDDILKENHFIYYHKYCASLVYPDQNTFTLINDGLDEFGVRSYTIGKNSKITYVHEFQHALKVFGLCSIIILKDDKDGIYKYD